MKLELITDSFPGGTEQCHWVLKCVQWEIFYPSSEMPRKAQAQGRQHGQMKIIKGIINVMISTQLLGCMSICLCVGCSVCVCLCVYARACV